MSRQFAKAFYNSKIWKKQRIYMLKKYNYLCSCGSLASEVHHIIHLTPENINDYSISLNEKNLCIYCKECHFAQHRLDAGIVHIDKEYMFDEQGYAVEVESK